MSEYHKHLIQRHVQESRIFKHIHITFTREEQLRFLHASSFLGEGLDSSFRLCRERHFIYKNEKMLLSITSVESVCTTLRHPVISDLLVCYINSLLSTENGFIYEHYCLARSPPGYGWNKSVMGMLL